MAGKLKTKIAILQIALERYQQETGEVHPELFQELETLREMKRRKLRGESVKDLVANRQLKNLTAIELAKAFKVDLEAMRVGAKNPVFGDPEEPVLPKKPPRKPPRARRSSG